MPMDFYDVLGAPADASDDELKRAFRAKVREYHPDVNDHPDGDEQFKLVRTAHDVLSDPVERKDYDRMGHREYVDKRLDDVPPISVFPEAEATEPSDPGSEATVDSSASVDSDHSSPQRGTGSSTKKHTTSRNASSSRSSSSRSSSGGSTDTGSTGRSRSTGSSASTSNRQSSGRSQSTATNGSTGTTRSTNSNGTGESATSSTSTGADSSDRSWNDVTESARTGSTRSSTTAAAARRRRGLRRWYGVVLLSLLAYLAGVGTYAAPHAETLSGLATEVTNTPTTTLMAAFPLPSPANYVLETATAAASGVPGVGLLFLVGAVALPLVVLTAVAQYGHGSAWIYAVASLGPVVPLAAVRFASLPTALALVGLFLLPVFSGLGFLVDVGRYLYATR